MTDADLHAAYDNPYPPTEAEPVGLTADGEPYYEGDDIVTLDGSVYLYDALDADTILTALGIPVQTAAKEY